MRRLLLCLALLFLLGACSGPAAPSAITASSSAPDLSAVAGSYACDTEGVDEQYWPSLTLGEDGSFTFAVNLFAGMGHLEGSYVYDAQQKTVTLHVEKRDFEGMIGDKANEIYFDVSSDSGLMFRGSDDPENEMLGVTAPYDLFDRTE